MNYHQISPVANGRRRIPGDMCTFSATNAFRGCHFFPEVIRAVECALKKAAVKPAFHDGSKSETASLQRLS